MSSRNISDLHYKLRPIAEKFLTECTKAGVPVFITDTLRTWEEQANLYAQGRTKPGKIVTKSRPGNSWHNFGLAFDIAFKTPPAKGLYEGEWAKVVAIAKKLGLVWGGDFTTIHDKPHFEYHPNLTLVKARQYVSKGIKPTQIPV